MAMSPRLLKPHATGFNPKQLSGLELWLDAADASTLFDADTGGSLVAADGAVGRWVDKSGKGRNFTQATANNRPLWRSAGRNGRGTVEFDGSNDRLAGDGTQYVRTDTAFTALFVHIVDSTAGSYPALFSTKTDKTENFRFINSNDTGGGGYTDYAIGSGSNFARTRYTTAARGNWRYVLFDFIGSSALTNGSFSGRANKAALTRSQAGGFGSDTAASSSVGSESGGANVLKGQMAEIIMFSRVLTNAERDTLENYVTTKWAL